jgi:hypothetical protein
LRLIDGAHGWKVYSEACEYSSKELNGVTSIKFIVEVAALDTIAVVRVPIE